MVVTICRMDLTAPYLRGMSRRRCRKWDRKKLTWLDPQFLQLPYLQIPSILTSVAFKTSLSFSFVMLPVIVT
jgi:hypothetical protein